MLTKQKEDAILNFVAEGHNSVKQKATKYFKKVVDKAKWLCYYNKAVAKNNSTNDFCEVVGNTQSVFRETCLQVS